MSESFPFGEFSVTEGNKVIVREYVSERGKRSGNVEGGGLGGGWGGSKHVGVASLLSDLHVSERSFFFPCDSLTKERWGGGGGGEDV